MVTITTDREFAYQNVSNGTNRRIELPDSAQPRGLRKNSSPTEKFVFEYDGVKVLERLETGYPDVTMNHYAVSRHLQDQGISAQVFADLGSGVGFNGNYASMHLDAPHIVFADLNPHAMNNAMMAYALNHGPEIVRNASREQKGTYQTVMETGKHTLDFRLGDVLHTLDSSIDVAVAAPMFIPGICEVFPNAFRIFAFAAKKAGAELYIGHSNISRDWILGAAREAGSRVEETPIREIPLSFEYTDEKYFTVSQLAREELVPQVESALTNLGMRVNTEDLDRPKYWHTLMVSRLF